MCPGPRAARHHRRLGQHFWGVHLLLLGRRLYPRQLVRAHFLHLPLHGRRLHLDHRADAARALFVTSLFAFSTRALDHVDVIPLSFWSNLGGALLALAVVPFLGGFTLPTNQVGWAGTLGASACYMFAVLCEFSAIRWAGPARTALYFNLEPIVTMAAAALLLGESLLSLQYFGASLVIAALALAARADWTRPLSRQGEPGP